MSYMVRSPLPQVNSSEWLEWNRAGMIMTHRGPSYSFIVYDPRMEYTCSSQTRSKRSVSTVGLRIIRSPCLCVLNNTYFLITLSLALQDLWLLESESRS